jgi:hypothetical protein
LTVLFELMLRRHQTVFVRAESRDELFRTH